MRSPSLKVAKYHDPFRPMFPQQHVEAPRKAVGSSYMHCNYSKFSRKSQQHSKYTTQSGTIVFFGPHFLVKETLRSSVLPRGAMKKVLRTKGSMNWESVEFYFALKNDFLLLSFSGVTKPYKQYLLLHLC